MFIDVFPWLFYSGPGGKGKGTERRKEGDSIGCRASKHTTCSSSHPMMVMRQVRGSKNFTQFLYTNCSPDDINRKIYSSCATTGNLASDAESSFKPEIKLDRC